MTDLPTEIQLGPYLFDWNKESNEMFIGNTDEVEGVVEHVWPEKWQAFVDAVQK